MKPQTGTSKRTAAGSVELQTKWHIAVTSAYDRVTKENMELVGVENAKALLKHCVFNLDEECLMATGKNIKIVGSKEKKKHDNEKGSSRDSMTNIRCGNAANRQAATFMLLAGKKRNDDYSDDFLLRNGAAPGSTILMTESAFLCKEAWTQLVPMLCKSLRSIVQDAAQTFGIDAHTASKLKIVLSFDGFKCHLDPQMLVGFASYNILCLVENRDSSAINQAFDKLVARSGKKRAASVISMMTRSHVVL